MNLLGWVFWSSQTCFGECHLLKGQGLAIWRTCERDIALHLYREAVQRIDHTWLRALLPLREDLGSCEGSIDTSHRAMTWQGW